MRGRGGVTSRATSPSLTLPRKGAGESHLTWRAPRWIRIGIQRRRPRFENCVIAAFLIRKRLLTSSAAPYAIALRKGGGNDSESSMKTPSPSTGEGWGGGDARSCRRGAR